MPEIIDLLSSSPPRRPGDDVDLPPVSQHARRSSVSGQVFNNCDPSALEDEDLDVVLGSSIGRKLRARLSQRSSPNRPKPRIVSIPSSIGSDDFRDSRLFDDSTLDNLNADEFPSAQPAKRRRTSPSLAPGQSLVQKSLADVDAVFELSSEPEYSRPVQKRLAVEESVVDVLDLSDLGMPSFSSSAPAPKTSVNEISKDEDVVEVSFEGSIFYNDPIMSSSQPVKSTKSKVLSERTTNLLANLKSSKGKSISVTKPASIVSSKQSSFYVSTTRKDSASRGEAEDVDNIIDSSQPLTRTKSPVKRATSNVAGRSKGAEDKATERERKRLDKEANKEQKRLEKEQKAIDKQVAADRAEVNKKRTDKKKSSEEMIIELPKSIKGKSVGIQVEELIKEVDIESHYYQDEVDMSNDESTPSLTGTVIRWKRKIRSSYNEDLEEYESRTLKIERENHVLVYLTAEEFCTIAVVGSAGQAAVDNDTSPSEDTMKSNIDTFITLLRSCNTNTTIIFLIQGLAAYLKKSANAKNREYAAAVRAQNLDLEQSSSTQGRTSKKRKGSTRQVDLSFLTTDHIESLTIYLQLTHQPLHIHHTTSVATSAQQISAFTQHLSTRPYRLTEQRHNLAHASFCMASGQFKTGQGNSTDTFLKMLEQVNRITPSMALGIVNEGYETPKQLVEGFRKVERNVAGGGRSLTGNTREEREAKERAKLMLQDVKKAVNRDGGYADKRLGPAASKRMYRVFMSKDENLRDGIV